jgi:hypothetical protein
VDTGLAKKVHKIFPRVYQWLGLQTKLKRNQRAIDYTLQCCLDKNPQPNPWGYCTKVIMIVNGTFNERDYIESHEKIQEIPDEIRELIKGIG